MNTTYRIKTPITDVFDAIVQPDKMTGYFISSSSGTMKTGAKLLWEWADYGAKAKVNVHLVNAPEKISFSWGFGDYQKEVEINLKSISNSETEINITEGTFSEDKEDIARALEQKGGWTDFCCSLKAYLYNGINLRK